MSIPFESNPRKASALLWSVQGVVALVFLFAGSMKFIMPVAAMQQQIRLPGAFLHFIGACEVLGALGLILPGLLHVHEELTPLAAAGLVIIMIGAVAITLATMGTAPAVMPLVVGLLAAFVAYGRSKLGAQPRPFRPSVAHPAL